MAAKRTQWEVQSLLKAARTSTKGLHQRHVVALSVAATLIVVAVLVGTHAWLTRPRGKITYPKTHTTIQGRLVELKGYTRHLPPDRHYIWLAVDVPKLNLCWPKRRIYTPNKEFKIKIDERGPNPVFKVSLYAVNRDYHESILKWFDEIRLFWKRGRFTNAA